MPKAKLGNSQSKKVIQKKKEKIIDDKTFGLKNKNKSKKVQQHIQSVKKNVENSGDPKTRKMEDQRRKAKDHAIARKKAEEEERNALFGEALLAVRKKTTTNTKTVSEAKGRDHDYEKEKSGTSRAMKMMFKMDAKEMEEALKKDENYVLTLEDEVEQQRQMKLSELKEKNMKGTPVTEESFKAWQEKKRQKKKDTAKRIVEAEIIKKGSKGLSVLSGRDLFEYKKDLFKDENIIKESVDSDVCQYGNVEGCVPPPNELKQTVFDLNSDVLNIESDLFLEGNDSDLESLDNLESD